ncbi:MAG: phosphoribosylanthranilate isomerase [Terracidiphilus sp.]
MSLWVKICGNTSLADARLAVEAGADAVGFVFAPSPRRITAAEAASIIRHLPPNVEKIGVFVDAHVAEIYSTVRISGLTGVQLHFDADVDMPAKLHGRLGSHLRIMRVAHFDAGAADLVSKQIAEHARNLHVDGVLVDSCTATAVGGTGVAFDWTAARKTIFSDIGTVKLIAAGGLNPANVAKAVATLQPWGVDVVSGVEKEPGRKDLFKVREFVAKARAARQE